MLKFVPKLLQTDVRFYRFGSLLLFLSLTLIPAGASGRSPSEQVSRAGFAGPAFDKSFIPATIAPGSVSELRFEIINETAAPVSNLAFTDNMPAAITVASPLYVTNSCEGTLTAAEGSSTISLVGGEVAGSTSCIITVDVTSSTPGIHSNVSSVLSSSAGTGGTATADLTVDADRPSFSKAFSPANIDLGGRSTLTFTLDNSPEGSIVTGLSFTDDLPEGMEIADPANIVSTCENANVTAVSGTNQIAFSDGFLFADEVCTVSVDVKTTGTGVLVNRSSDLTHSSGSSGFASAELEVAVEKLYLTKEFVADPVAPGATVELLFSIENHDRLDSATDISFTDDLSATLAGLTAVGLPQNNICGAGTLSGTSFLTFSGGNLAPEANCTFSVTLQIPAGASIDSYLNTTSPVNAMLDGELVAGTVGSDTLFVAPVPRLTKTFLDDPVAAGDDVVLEFNIENGSATLVATEIEFEDDLSTFLPVPLTVQFSPDPPCGPGSSVGIASMGTDGQGISFQDGTLDPGAACTFTATITLPLGMGSGSYLNMTSDIMATVDGNAIVGPPASDTLEVVAAPILRKSFIDDPVLPGEMVTLEFTIEQRAEEPGDATAIAFTDDLNAVLTGLTAVGLPQNDVCGPGSQLSGAATLSLTGGTLSPGEICTFEVQLQLPGGDLLPGNYPNITSNLTAVSSGLAVTGLPAEDDLMIGGLAFSKSFLDDPTIPGDTVTLEFTIENDSATYLAEDIFFSDSLSSVLPGLAAVAPLPTEPCGSGSTLVGTSTLFLIGGTLAAETSCSFTVTLEVPAGTDNDSYTNLTSDLTATMDSNGVTISPAVDTLVVDSNFIFLTKQYTSSPVLSGDKTTLRFTLENLHQTENATDIEFMDDLDASLSGLTAVLPLPNEPCGAGSQITGTSILSFTDGVLDAGASCVFEVMIQVPEDIPNGTQYENITSGVTAMLKGFDVTGFPAVDSLVIGVPPIYFPIVAIDAVFAPDLIVSMLDVTQNTVEIVITNAGTTAVTDSFWVDLYIDPDVVPSQVNQIWEAVGEQGAVWGVEDNSLPLQVGESITLTLNDTYYFPGLSQMPAIIPVGTPIYVQVDSANANTIYGAVLETHEIGMESYNNIFGPVLVTND